MRVALSVFTSLHLSVAQLPLSPSYGRLLHSLLLLDNSVFVTMAANSQSFFFLAIFLYVYTHHIPSHTH